MSLVEELIRALTGLGLDLLVQRLKTDWDRPDGFWKTYDCERKKICSFLNIYLDHNDADARLTLCPTNEAHALVSEIISDVIPVIRRKLGV